MNTFEALGLAKPIVSALEERGFDQPTPIQAQAIPEILAGRDLLGIAATGTGKTAAFALPILQQMLDARTGPNQRYYCAVILSPTRELATQIANNFRVLGRMINPRIALVVGGASMRMQAEALKRRPNVIVATPGRLIDHINQGVAVLEPAEVLVLDEVDQMLEVGFLPAVRRIVERLPAERQNLFFSATMPPQIGALSRQLQRDPVTVSVVPSATPAERIDQQVVLVEQGDKLALLRQVVTEGNPGRCLVFTRTKHGADRLVKQLGQVGLESAALHGNRSQSQRERALAEFRDGRTRILVATDVAARGVHVDAIELVINFELPNVAETYVHRIGRTARAGAAGTAISFCSSAERPHLRAIEGLLKVRLPTRAFRSSGNAAASPAAALQERVAPAQARTPAAPPPPATPTAARPRGAAPRHRRDPAANTAAAASPPRQRRQPAPRRPNQGGSAPAEHGLANLSMFKPVTRKKSSSD